MRLSELQAAPADLDFSEPTEPEPRIQAVPEPFRVSGTITIPAPRVERIEVDAVIGGCLMKLSVSGVEPAGVLPWLRTLDPACKVRDDFPAKAAFGKRETKRARLMVITLRASDNGLFIDLVCKGDAEVSVAVGKKKAPEFIGMLAGTNRVSDEHLDKLQTAADGKGQATVILDSTEAVDVEYWSSDDGKAFLESLHAGAET